MQHARKIIDRRKKLNDASFGEKERIIVMVIEQKKKENKPESEKITQRENKIDLKFTDLKKAKTNVR